MSQQIQGTSESKVQPQRSSLAAVCIALFFGIILSAALTIGVGFGLENVLGTSKTAQASSSSAHQAVAPEKHVHLNLSIIINQPGLHQDWPAYSPAHMVLPANSLVTLTIRNYDLGDTALPQNSPFANVQGTVGNMATVDGHSYTSLAVDKVAHTFTIAQLNLNVPIPGDAAKGASYASVTFTFHTGKAGTYTFKCLDPCGTGPMGWMGPMMTKGYMTGTITVQ